MIQSKVLSFLLIGCFIFFQDKVLGWAQTLSDRATNPITNLSQLQFENDFTPNNYGTNDSSNSFTIKPLIALDRFSWIPVEQLIRFKFQVPTLPNSSETKKGTYLGDMQFFDLFVIEDPTWGRCGIGPMAIFPTASTVDAGQGKWQLGPACGLSILKFKRWQIGFLAQNPISFAGNHHRLRQNYLLFQPFIIYHFEKNSYLITNSEWTVDWLHQNTQIPVNIGFGHTTSLGTLKVDSCLQFQYMAYQNATTYAGYVNQYTVQFSFSILFD